MAHYVPIPKDLNDIKEKFIMGFTKRQRYYRTTNIFVSIERQIELGRIKKKLRDVERKG